MGCLAEDGETYSTPDGFDAHPNCRCAMVPVVPGFEPEASPAQQWFDSQSEETQLAMMGAGRFELYSSGAVGWSDLSTRTWNDTWGGAIVPTNVGDLRATAGVAETAAKSA